MPDEKKEVVVDPASKDGKSTDKKRGGKRQGRRGGRRGGEGQRESRKPWCNDAEWYAANPQLIKDAASFPYSHFMGLDVSGFPDSVGPQSGHFYTSDTFALRYIPVIGKADTVQSAFNLAVRNVYTYVRHMNSGSKNYEAPDLGIYLLCTASVLSLIAELERIYGVAQSFQLKNRAFPYHLLEALGVRNPYDLQANMADFRKAINVQVFRAASLCIPKGFSFIDRWIWMNSHIFKDSETEKASLYCFVPYGHYMFMPTTYSTGGMCRLMTVDPYSSAIVPVEIAYNKSYQTTDWQTKIELLRTMLDAILEDEDMNVMSGDIMKAYDSNNLWKLVPLPEDYFVEGEYSKEVLSQIHNATIIRRKLPSFGAGEILYTPNPDTETPNLSYIEVCQLNGTARQVLTQYSSSYTPTAEPINGLNFIPTPYTSAVALSDFAPDPAKRILDLMWDDVKPEDTMVASRLIVVADEILTVPTGGATSGSIIRYISGTEIVVDIDIVGSAPGNIGTSHNGIGVTAVYTGQLNLYVDIAAMVAHSQFDWAPFEFGVALFAYSGGSQERDMEPIYSYNGTAEINGFGDIYNFTFIDRTRVSNMHDVALLGEFVARATLGTLTVK